VWDLVSCVHDVFMMMSFFDARCVDMDTVLGFLVFCTFLFVYAIDRIATSIDPCLLPSVVSGRSSLCLIGLWSTRINVSMVVVVRSSKLCVCCSVLRSVLWYCFWWRQWSRCR
jgi:hypothetical protein